MLFVSLDEITHNLLQGKGIVSFLNLDVGRMASAHSGFNTHQWKRKGHVKIKMAATLVRMGYSVLTSDLDITYFKDPFVRLDCYTCDLEIMSEHDVQNSQINAGLAYFRPTKTTRILLHELGELLRSKPWLWDQTELQSLIDTYSRKRGLKYRQLPFDTFTSGAILAEWEYMYFEPPEELFQKMVLLHHQHQAYEGKIFRMRELGLWMTDEDGYYSNPKTKYLVYDNPVHNLKHMEWGALNNAFKLGKLLNRKVILPKFSCLRPRRCPAPRFGMHGRSSGCYCSLIHHLQDVYYKVNYELYVNFEADHRDEFRETTFLKHVMVPDSVKTSFTDVYAIMSELVHVIPALSSDVKYMLVPKDVRTGPTREELLQWFTPFKDVSILRLKSIYGDLQI